MKIGYQFCVHASKLHTASALCYFYVELSWQTIDNSNYVFLVIVNLQSEINFSLYQTMFFKSSWSNDVLLFYRYQLYCSQRVLTRFVKSGFCVINLPVELLKARNCISYQERKLLQRNLNFENYCER